MQAEPVRAITENVSRTGMLMRWVEGIPLPNIDGKLVLDLQLPENSEFGPRVMRCRAAVIRVTPGAGKSHEVALRILSMRFIKPRRMVRPIDLLAMPVAADRVS